MSALTLKRKKKKQQKTAEQEKMKQELYEEGLRIDRGFRKRWHRMKNNEIEFEDYTNDLLNFELQQIDRELQDGKTGSTKMTRIEKINILKHYYDTLKKAKKMRDDEEAKEIRRKYNTKGKVQKKKDSNGESFFTHRNALLVGTTASMVLRMIRSRRNTSVTSTSTSTLKF